MTTALRDRVAAELGRKLSTMQDGAREHRSDALAQRAALRRGVHAGFGGAPRADAALLRMITLPRDEHGDPPSMTWSLERLLDDAMLVASLVAATGVGVRTALAVAPDAAPAARRRGSLGRDLRRLKARESGIGEQLLTALLGAGRDELPPHLRRACALMASDDARLDVGALVRDLGGWDADDRRVQKRWAYDFWARADTPDPAHDNEEENP